jgi:hypothetical protein
MAPGQIEKQQFQNNTDGWIGAVVIGPNGQERGIAVEPGGTVWLSEPDQVLTANAPRRAQDNPFIEQVMERTDPVTGERSEQTVTPLSPITANRFVPAGLRYVPGTAATGARGTAEAQAAATGAEPVMATTVDMGAIGREQEVRELGDTAQPFQPPPVPRAAAAAIAAAETAAAATPEDQMTETAVAVPEETGAATPPTGPPPEGEYQASEEVGTPVPSQPEPPAPAEPAPSEETAVTPDEPAPADVAAAEAEESAEQAQAAADSASEAAESAPAQPAPYTPPEE